MIARTVAQLWLSSCEIVKISLHVQVKHWWDTTSEVTNSSLRVTSPLSNLQGNPTETLLTSNLPGWPLVWWSSPLPVLTMRHGDLGALRSLSLSYSWHILFSSATLVSMDIGNNQQLFTYLKFAIMSFPCLFSLWNISHDAVFPGTWGVSKSGLHSFFCFYT